MISGPAQVEFATLGTWELDLLDLLETPSWECGCTIGNPWENHGKTMGKAWEKHGKSMGKAWENHGKTMDDLGKFHHHLNQ